ncbi:hypothetical protein LELG_02906 [Lodderomyces elongisporus NRRL YB-4239]|uniref:Myb/SANT-like DNA-binding domain-containing protein n=1 Tax=Lodderomyces elongisporus (strain ATCC 11503 / CBS 2605 / JCM 1781 / NBRC 1676 / NRRL YB-4239) TaxID=379508 RepID=A5DZW9_LODEL|nr:hypothetical protein LELG_02906 [Lodderomyces elongisporus NRRL YB-4239]
MSDEPISAASTSSSRPHFQFTYESDTVLLDSILENLEGLFTRGSKLRTWETVLLHFNLAFGSNIVQSRTIKQRFQALKKSLETRFEQEERNSSESFVLNENETKMKEILDFLLSMKQQRRQKIQEESNNNSIKLNELGSSRQDKRVDLQQQQQHQQQHHQHQHQHQLVNTFISAQLSKEQISFPTSATESFESFQSLESLQANELGQALKRYQISNADMQLSHASNTLPQTFFDQFPTLYRAHQPLHQQPTHIQQFHSSNAELRRYKSEVELDYAHHANIHENLRRHNLDPLPRMQHEHLAHHLTAQSLLNQILVLQNQAEKQLEEVRFELARRQEESSSQLQYFTELVNSIVEQIPESEDENPLLNTT